MYSIQADEEDAVSGNRRCVLLAGVHAGVREGGVDALSRILVHLGVDQLCDTGDFADRLQALNQAILDSAGFEECSIEPLHTGWYSSLRHAEFHERAVELVGSAHAASALFVLKDNAIGRLVPFWQGVLKACGVEPVVLDFYEDPASFVAGFSQTFGVGGEAARTVWLARVIESERASRGLVRAKLTRKALLDDWEAALSRLSEALGVTWPAWSARVRRAIVEELARAGTDAADAPLRKLSPADQIGRWIQEAQDVLWHWADAGEGDSGRARMDELCAIFEGARESLGPAFAALAEMGQSLRIQKQVADDLLVQVAELRREPHALSESLSAPALAGDGAARHDALADRSAGDNRHAAPAPAPADGDEQRKFEARWEQVFRARLQASEILAEQNGVFQATIERLTTEIRELKARLAQAKANVERLRLVEIAKKAEMTSARSEISKLQKSQNSMNKSLVDAQKRVSRLRSEVLRLRSEAANREATIEELQNALLARAAVGDPPAEAAPPARGISLSPKSLLLYLNPKARKQKQRHDQMRQMVLASGLFDAGFYAARYPDVVAAGVDLLDHFITIGGAEGRHPSQSFNSRWYLNEYPDIRAGGLNPLVHYIEHGRDDGRRRRSLADATAASTERAEAAAAPTSDPQGALGQAVAPPPDMRAETSELEGTWRPRVGGWKALLASDTDRRSPVVSLDELARQADAHTVAVGDRVVALFASDTTPAAVDRIALFAAMRPGAAASVTVAGEQASDCAPHRLLAESGCGHGLLADAWCDSESGLTLRLANGFAGVARVFQVDADGSLHCVAEAVLGGGDADCVDVGVLDPLAPLLVILTTRGGALVDSAVVPFPSLLRGGLHCGELAVIETAPGSMATLAEYSRMLVLEWLGWDEGPDRFAIGQMEIDMRGATGTEPIFRPALLSSIARHFGITIRAREGSYPPQREQLVAILDEAGRAGAAREDTARSLVLPSDAVPSIYALVARRMSYDLALSRFVVVDPATARPQADISLPFDEGLARFQHAEMPAHAPYVASSVERETGSGGPVFPLAVRHYNSLAWEADPLIPVSPDCDMPMEEGLAITQAITVVIDTGQDSDGLANCLAALENQIGAERLEVILAGWPEDMPLPGCELPVRAIDARDATRAGRLNAAAQLSQAPRLLFLAPSVLLSDPRTAATLSRMADRPGTASVACALVTQLHDDGEARVHSAGYYPTRVSLHGEPVFDFDQVDIARALPAATFPVVANHAKCVLYDAAIFHSLGGFDAQQFPMAMHDLDFGFRALAAGHANLCTTLVRAAVDDAAPSADFPDALAHRSVRPADWQSLLDRVTVVRELRR
jgi:hypothetical protein